MTAYLRVMLGLQKTVFPDLCELWVWARAGLGTDLARDVNKQQERKTEQQASIPQAVIIAGR